MCVCVCYVVKWLSPGLGWLESRWGQPGFVNSCSLRLEENWTCLTSAPAKRWLTLLSCLGRDEESGKQGCFFLREAGAISGHWGVSNLFFPPPDRVCSDQTTKLPVATLPVPLDFPSRPRSWVTVLGWRTRVAILKAQQVSVGSEERNTLCRLRLFRGKIVASRALFLIYVCHIFLSVSLCVGMCVCICVRVCWGACSEVYLINVHALPRAALM